MDLERLSDQELLVVAREAPQAFAAFYRRHVHAVHGGAYRIVVRYRTVSARPGPYASLDYPGVLVGQARVDVP
jgi:hypothetical protein